MMNTFSFILSRKHFIFPSILNNNFAEWSNLGHRSLLFITLNTYCQSLLACKVSFEKSANSLMGASRQVALCFPLAAFKILSLTLTLGILTMTCLGMVLYPAKLSFRMKGQIKCLPDKVRLKEFIITKPLLYEMLKGLI